MRTVPIAEPGVPDTRSPNRFLWWMARGQWNLLLLNMVVCTIWMTTGALLPTVLGLAIERGIVGGDSTALIRWSLAIFALAVVGAIFGTTWHRVAVTSWMRATFRTIALVGDHVLHAGPAMPARVPTGEVVSVVASDAMRIANLYESSGQIAGAVVSYGVVASILLSRDTTLGLIVLLGVPLVTAMLASLLRPLQRRQNAAREAAGALTTLGSDTVAGLRVLRGIGGEATFLRRYDEQSAQVLRRGCEVAPVHAALDAARVLLPGIFVVIVTWNGASAVRSGAVDPGDLVAFYGTAAYLAMPLGFATQFVSHLIRARVGAAKVIAILTVRSDTEETTDDGTGEHAGDDWLRGSEEVAAPDGPAALHDPTSGVRLAPGEFTAVVTHTPQDARAVADRLARFGPRTTPARWGSVALAQAPLPAVRSRIVLAHGDATLFSGSLRAGLTPRAGADEAAVARALRVASAEDVIAALPYGLDSEVTERGRNFSGGQRQRLSLVRALLTDAEVLILMDPTSAVDAHTEARIATRLAAARAGRCTVAFTASPLLAEHADTVIFVHKGQVVARGTHQDLLASDRRYADLVLRGAARDVSA
ncbi:MAG: ABC transporter ATP-binding protein [Ornithinimicrobium sp.]